MAITATIALSKSTVQINQPLQAVVTISNSGASDVNVQAVTPLIKMTGSSDPTPYNTAVAAGQPDLGPGVNVTVPASGSLAVSFPLTAFAPTTGPLGAGSGSYDVLCEIQTSDGSETRPTAATLTVNPLPDTQPQYH